MGASLCKLCVPNTFSGRVGFDVDGCHIFPQGVLATITMVGGEAGDGVARAGAQCEVGLPLCSVATSTLSGV